MKKEMALPSDGSYGWMSSFSYQKQMFTISESTEQYIIQRLRCNDYNQVM